MQSLAYATYIFIIGIQMYPALYYNINEHLAKKKIQRLKFTNFCCVLECSLFFVAMYVLIAIAVPL